MNSIKIKIPSFSIVLIFICLAIVGLFFIPKLTVKLVPSQIIPQLTVRFSMSGSAPIVIEKEVTSKLESMLARIKNVKKITSVSSNGSGRITLHFDKHVDMDVARFEASTIIRQTWSLLPDKVSYPSISVARSDNNSNRAFLYYTVISPSTPRQIQQYVENNVKTQLAQIEGVYQIDVRGAKQMEWQLEYDYKELETLGLSVDDIYSAINTARTKEFLGVVSVSSQENTETVRLVLASDIRSQQIDDLSNIAVKNINGSLIRLKDIVSVKYIESDASSYYRINGKNTISMTVFADETANQIELARVVKSKLDEIKLKLPPGYEIQLSSDATEYIKDELEKVYFRSGLTILVLVLFVFLIYRSIKYGLLIIISAFVNISISIIFYYILKLELQLYSIAGIAVSLTLIIDNMIVMSDQILKQGNKKAILAILATTVTTIGSLMVVYFLDEKLRLNLTDFAAVIIINLFVSSLVALFFIPALMEKMRILPRQPVLLTKKRKKCPSIKYKWYKNLKYKIRGGRSVVYFFWAYASFCRFVWRKRIMVIVIIILSFGLPVFLLPDKMEDNAWISRTYNSVFDTSVYRENIKPYTNAILGGTWRLFVEKVYEGSYVTERGEETSLNITASLPNGATVEQMNSLIQKMEKYLEQFSEIKQFETNVSGANRSSININFHKEYQQGNFPHVLKSELISKSLQLGGGSWSVYGVGDGFSNNVKESSGSYHAEMLGFNYDELEVWANRFKNKLLKYNRIKDVTIDSEFSWYKSDYQEFNLSIDKERLVQEKLSLNQLFRAIKPFFERRISAGFLLNGEAMEQIVLISNQSKHYNLWDLNNIPIKSSNHEIKLSDLAIIEKHQAPKNISKIDQQYKLCIQYDYIGAFQQGQYVLEKEIEIMQQELPIGYTIKSDQSRKRWGKSENTQYWLLGLVIAIIFFCSSILFNSLRQPFCIIFIIPLSFIGIFLTFYLFELNFDQGGFASFILLSGLTVNANIYILNEYNNIRKIRKISPLRAYIKAWKSKIKPVMLTVVSTILGFVPFMIGYKEGFWFPLAAGTIGGLIISLIATFCFLHLFMGVAKGEIVKKKKQ